MSKHSPGPWKWVEDSEDDEDCGSFVDANGEEVCWFGDDAQYYPTAGREPSDADTRLIAAAPELLAALKEALRLSGDWFEEAESCDHRRQGEWVDSTRAIIARIEGDTSE